jgi:hypothetical protein
LLDGLDLHSQQVCSTQDGGPRPGLLAPDEQNPLLTTGLGAGDARLVVPAGGVLAVYGNLNSRVPAATRGSGSAEVATNFFLQLMLLAVFCRAERGLAAQLNLLFSCRCDHAWSERAALPLGYHRTGHRLSR